MSAKLTLELIPGKKGIELWRSVFTRVGADIVTLRGKAVVYSDAGSFQWTRAVKGLTLLLSLAYVDGEHEFLLRGGSKSLAHSLDYAISKCPCWTTDMFGFFPNGDPVFKRLFKRHNPGLRYGRTVGVGLNKLILSPSDIRIKYQGCEVSREEYSILLAEWLKTLRQDYLCAEEKLEVELK